MGLILARLVIYAAEGVAFYSLVATVLAGTEEEVEWLVELTRIILCEVSDKMGTKATRGARAKREADSWTDLVQRVNSTRPKMAEILQDLYQTSTNFGGHVGDVVQGGLCGGLVEVLEDLCHLRPGRVDSLNQVSPTVSFSLRSCSPGGLGSHLV